MKTFSQCEEKSIYLQLLCSAPLRIVWHENRTNVLSVKEEGRGLYLRLHRLFAKAPSPVLEAVASYIVKGDKRSSSVIRQMVHWHFSQEHSPASDLEAKGNVYDLHAIYHKIRNTYFSQNLEIAIGWSKQGGGGRFRHMTFGSFDRHRNQIRIHPLLDDPKVPLYFLEFIVYHEMLHAVCPSRIDKRGRIFCHTQEFRDKERLFADYAKAKVWEKGSLQFFKNRSKVKKRSYGRA